MEPSTIPVIRVAAYGDGVGSSIIYVVEYEVSYPNGSPHLSNSLIYSSCLDVIVVRLVFRVWFISNRCFTQS